MKINKNKKLVFILLTIILSYISFNKIYISLNCNTPEKALLYHATHNKNYNVEEIINSDLIFSSDDLVIYDMQTISKKDFEYEEFYTIKLKKKKNTWKLFDIQIKN